MNYTIKTRLLTLAIRTILISISLLGIPFILFFMGVISIAWVWFFVAVIVLKWLMKYIKNREKIIFILIPTVVLGFMGILPASMSWIGGALIILSCLVRQTSLTSKNVTPQQILNGFIPKPQLGYSPLHQLAMSNENPDVIKALLTFKKNMYALDIYARDEHGVMPLHLACSHNKNPEVIKALLDAGANPQTQDNQGEAAIHWAAKKNTNPEIIQLLLNTIVEVDDRAWSYGCWTPLHFAARYNKNPEIIMTLLKLGADGKMGDTEEAQTPFDLAKKNRSVRKSPAYQALKEAQF